MCSSVQINANPNERKFQFRLRRNRDTETKSIILQADKIQDEYQVNVNYEYKFHLNIDDIAAILKKFSEKAISEMPRGIHDKFKGILADLIRIVTCAAGNVPGPMPPSEAEA